MRGGGIIEQGATTHMSVPDRRELALVRGWCYEKELEAIMEGVWKKEIMTRERERVREGGGKGFT